MDFRAYLPLAFTLANGGTEAEWRSGTSRAYYAAFHVARELLSDLGFVVPRAERSHGYVWLRLANSGEAAVIPVGNKLNDLRGERNRADYDAHRSLDQALAVGNIQTARTILNVLDAAAVEPVRSQITAAMRDYERDVLKDVTWQPPPP